MKRETRVLGAAVALLWSGLDCQSSFRVGVDYSDSGLPSEGGDAEPGNANRNTDGVGGGNSLDSSVGGTVEGRDGATGGGRGGAGGGGDSAGAGGVIVEPITPVSCDDPDSRVTTAYRYAPGYSPDQAVLDKVEQALSTMSLEDKIAQMAGTSYGTVDAPNWNDVQRSYDTKDIRGWRYRDASRGMNLGEDMDGVHPRLAYSTVFPVSMARGASFDLDLEYEIGRAIGDEMAAAKQTDLLAPCMNLLRHPLWGRAQETYGEDPYHLGRLASAMTVGIQEHIAATAKHYAAYDIEQDCAENNSEMDEQTLREIYGRHFRMVVRDGGVASFMAAYNKVNGEKCTQNAHLLTDVLRTDFGFRGFVLSDMWATPAGQTIGTDPSTLKAQAVEAVKAGLDVELPWRLVYSQLESLLNTSGSGITRDDIDASVRRNLEQRYRFNADRLDGNVGLKPATTTYDTANGQILNNDEHIKLAEKAAVRSMVLLKNDHDTLPIKRSIKKVAVLGAIANFTISDGGANYMGTLNFATGIRTGDLGSSRAYFDPAKGASPFDGIKKVAGSGTTVVSGTRAEDAKDADFVVVVVGLTAEDEGEEYTLAGDRKSLALDDKATTKQQDALVNAVAALGKPMVVVIEAGAAIDMPWIDKVPAVVMAWYPGMVGGNALGKLLFGDEQFGGKLPFTWPASVDELDTFNGPNNTTHFDYYVGYRIYDHKGSSPKFPFGWGLSYTTFEYRKLELGCSDMTARSVLPVYVTVANTGKYDADETIMVFVSFPNTKARRGVKELKAFQRINIKAGEAKKVMIPVRVSDLDYFDMDKNQWVIESDDVKIQVGPNSSDLPLTATIRVRQP